MENENREWKEVRLGDLVEILGDGLHGTPKYDENGEYYFINGNNLNGRIVINSQTKRVNYTEFLKYKKNLNERTILVSINGTLGNVAFYNGEKIILGKSACYFNISDNTDKYFIKYVLVSNIFKDYIQNYATGTTIKNIGLKQMREFSFNLPPLPEQKRIAEILSSLDDKIELNNQMNKTLEEMAQAIFKQWFVDFEFPNENGEPYKSSGGEMEESELGLIPKGWRVAGLDKIAEFLNGLAMQKYPPESEEEYLPVVKIKELRTGITADSDKASKNIDNKYIINDGDILFSWSGSLEVVVWTGGIGGLNQHLFKVSSSEYPKWFYYLWTKYHLEKFRHIAETKATTMGHIKREDLSKSLVVISTEEILEIVDNNIAPILEKIIINSLENRKLTKIRDTLLPRLMSGEIDFHNSPPAPLFI